MIRDSMRETKIALLLTSFVTLVWLVATAMGGGSSTVELNGVESKKDSSLLMKGVHYFARSSSAISELSNLKKHHIGEIVLVPYAYQSAYDDPKLRASGRRPGSHYRRDSTYLVLAAAAHQLGIRCIIKPHIWLPTDGDKWRSDILFEQEQDWKQWSTAYTDFILHYAELSERIGAKAFCIGTELSQLTRSRADYWRSLIDQVRAVYTGKVFYAANWFEEYEHLTFWGSLDYIGIQAYFPLSVDHEPSISALCRSWKPYVQKLARFSKQHQKPILFTELGYKSTTDAAIEPWKWLDRSEDRSTQLSFTTQANCYESFFQSFWDQDWFAGVLIWQWRTGSNLGSSQDMDFTPQEKPAQEVLRSWFAQ